MTAIVFAWIIQWLLSLLKDSQIITKNIKASLIYLLISSISMQTIIKQTLLVYYRKLAHLKEDSFPLISTNSSNISNLGTSTSIIRSMVNFIKFLMQLNQISVLSELNHHHSVIWNSKMIIK